MSKAIVVTRTGGPEVLQYQDMPIGRPRKDEVQIAVQAIGVNFIDIYQRSGLYAVTMPFIPGGEMCGEVLATGAGVTDFKIGDRVATATAGNGCYAEIVNVPAARLLKVPREISSETAAAMLLKGMTAQVLLRQVYRVQKGETILIHAAAGGVGMLMCQWANALGATVIGTVSSAAKAKLAQANGCHHTINYTSKDFVKEVRRITKGAMLPVVYDSIGQATFPASLDCLHKFGLFVTFGNSSGPVPPFSPSLLMQKGSLYMTRPTLFNFIDTPDALRKTAGEVMNLVKKGTLNVSINNRYPLSEAARAHADLAARKTTGSIILVP